ncbi:MAG: aminotransferase class V-fold PLP-dependent enzyme [Phenylobacterium sp.]|nr:aminotransferase class V-fold PLP-dependent enzyme [Phenylobacterium sp.]
MTPNPDLAPDLVPDRAPVPVPDSLAACRRLDRADPFSALARRFRLPAGVVYLDGNSLGPLPRASEAAVRRATAAEWGRLLVGGWNAADWIGLPARTAERIAPLIGADPDEVACADSVSVNLFKLAAGALALRPDRKVLLAAEGDFPTDGYMLQGLSRLRPDIRIRITPRHDIAGALSDDVAVLMLSHADYRTGALADLHGLSRQASAAGVLTLWDLSHTTGLAPIGLAAAGADMAVGCGYKYLNGGPGAPAFAFLARRHHEAFANPLSGWMGHERPFDFAPGYAPAAGAARLMAGTPPILSLTALNAALELFDGLDPTDLLERSRRLSDLFLARAAPTLEAQGFNCVSPALRQARGGHLAFAHPQAYPVVQALIAAGVVGDFRAPDLMRLGFSPLFLSRTDVWAAADRFARIMETGAWRNPAFAEQQRVT